MTLTYYEGVFREPRGARFGRVSKHDPDHHDRAIKTISRNIQFPEFPISLGHRQPNPKAQHNDDGLAGNAEPGDSFSSRCYHAAALMLCRSRGEPKLPVNCSFDNSPKINCDNGCFCDSDPGLQAASKADWPGKTSGSPCLKGHYIRRVEVSNSNSGIRS